MMHANSPDLSNPLLEDLDQITYATYGDRKGSLSFSIVKDRKVTVRQLGCKC